MPRNIRRLSFEVSAFQNRYGFRNVTVPSDYAWVKLDNFQLDRGMFNLDYATILIIIPPDYDLQKISECYVDADLCMRNGADLPHLHGSAGYEIEGFKWLCFLEPCGKNTGLLGFLETLRCYFSNPNEYVKINGG
jgi:hypothetical protein